MLYYKVDHRVPYEIGGEHDEKDIDNFMLLSPSANRAKSWTCEHCSNWDKRDINICLRCFWAYPEDYDHVAGKPEKIVPVIFSGDEIDDYNKLTSLAGEETAQATIKKILHEHLKQKLEKGSNGANFFASDIRCLFTNPFGRILVAIQKQKMPFGISGLLPVRHLRNG